MGATAIVAKRQHQALPAGELFYRQSNGRWQSCRNLMSCVLRTLMPFTGCNLMWQETILHDTLPLGTIMLLIAQSEAGHMLQGSINQAASMRRAQM